MSNVFVLRPKRQTLGQVLPLHGETRATGSAMRSSVPNVNRLGRYCHDRRGCAPDVPNVNRLGRYCHALVFVHHCLEPLVPNINRLGRYLGRYCHIRVHHPDVGGDGVPNVNRLGRYCPMITLWQSRDMRIVPNVNRLGRYYHPNSPRSQTSTAWASIATPGQSTDRLGELLS
jgi:hypothetical protein